VRAAPLLERAGADRKDFVLGGLDPDDAESLRRHERTGRPLGSERFVVRAERALGRVLWPRRPGPRPRTE